MGQPIVLYNTRTGERVVMYAPTTAAALVAQGGFSYAPVPMPATAEALLAIDSDLTLHTAAMKGKISELAGMVADGSMTAEDAIAALNDFAAPLLATTETLLASDLTLIAGIGPKRATALNDAGIYTYAALARADAAALATAVGAPLAQAQQWVTAARAIEAVEVEP